MTFLTALLLLTPTQAPPVMPLRLIPYPKEIKRLEGRFTFQNGTRITWNSEQGDFSFEAHQIIQEVRQRMSLSIRSEPDSFEAPITLEISQQPEVPSHDQGYLLSITPTKIRLASRTPQGLFYGVQTLRQIIRANREGPSIPCLTIKDQPTLNVRGWQDDVSRGPIPTLEFLKKQIALLSEYKLNAFTLYTEHVFRLKKHPSIAPPDGLTAEEIKELVAFAKKHHVEVIGNFQSFGHFASILKVPGYEELGEANWVLSPALEKSYAFLEDVFSEMAPVYESPWFHINGDEVWGLGSGASKSLVEEKGFAEVYAGHINRVAEMLKKYNKVPLMWGDMALAYPEIIPKLSKEVIVLTWGYHPQASWENFILPFKNAGLKFLVCPGISCWGEIFPNTDQAYLNISSFARDGALYGALGMLTTTWDDSGENLFNFNWHGLLWSAECSWNPPLPNAGEDRDTARARTWNRFNRNFPALFFGEDNLRITDALLSLSRLRRHPASYAMKDQAFWKDIPSLLRPDTPEGGQELVEEAERLASFFVTTKVPDHQEALWAAGFSAKRMAWLGRRALLIEKMKNADDPEARSTALQEVSRLSQDLLRLRDEYAQLWRLENREGWLKENLNKYSNLLKHLLEVPALPLFVPSGPYLSRPMPVSILTLSPAIIHYTTDGSEPTVHSPVFSAPIIIEKNTRIRARAFSRETPLGPITEATFRLLRFPATLTTTLPTHQDFVPESAFDGDETTFFWSSRPARAGDFFLVILESPLSGVDIRVITGHPDHPEDIVYRGVLEVTSDGQKFVPLAEFRQGVAVGSPDIPLRGIRIRVTEDSRYWVLIREILLTEKKRYNKKDGPRARASLQP